MTLPLESVPSVAGSGAQLDIQALPYYQNVTELTNAACSFRVCTIIDTTSGTVAVNGQYFRIAANGAVTALSLITTQNGSGASLGDVRGFAEVGGNKMRLRLDSTNGARTTPIYFENGKWNAATVSASWSSQTLGNASTLQSRYARYTATLSQSAVGANTCTAQTVTVTGVQASDIILRAQKPSEQPGLSIAGACATAANTVSLQLCNNISNSIIPTAGEGYTVLVVQ